MEIQRNIFLDPSYTHFNNDGLFALSDSTLNRDGQLLPFVRLKTMLAEHGWELHTADLIKSTITNPHSSSYSSLGITSNFGSLASSGQLMLDAFVLMEPPVVAPDLYAMLPTLTRVFRRVYVHNTTGDGYDCTGVEMRKLHRFYWPIPYDDVIEQHWIKGDRQRRIVVINGNHNPRGRPSELYSMRIRAMAELSKLEAIDLYGQGWAKWWSRKSTWWPYWANLTALLGIYKGPCDSKFPILAKYDFCLCLENMKMSGYITEKIFDCFYAGTIPLYLGAPDITKYVPADAFIDCRNFSDWTALWETVSKMTREQIETMRNAGRAFIRSEGGRRFVHSLDEIFRPTAIDMCDD